MSEQMKKITTRVTLIILSAISAFMMFLPAYNISASAFGRKESISISGMTAFTGKVKGMEIFDSMSWMMLCLILPIVVIVLLVLKKYEDDLTAKITAGATGVNMFFWIIYVMTISGHDSIREAREELSGYGSFGVKVSIGPSFWFYLNVIIMALTIALAVFVILKKADMEQEITEVCKNLTNSVASKTGKASNGADAVTSEPVAEKMTESGRCPLCGGAINADSRFCPNCGAMVEAPEEEKKEDVIFCSGCGNKLPADAVFCEECGTKVK